MSENQLPASAKKTESKSKLFQLFKEIQTVRQIADKSIRASGDSNIYTQLQWNE